MFVFLPSLSNFLVEYMARPIRKKSGTGIYYVLRYALSFGAGVRQLSRLTGVSFGVVQKLNNDHQNRPHDSRFLFAKSFSAFPQNSYDDKQITAQA